MTNNQESNLKLQQVAELGQTLGYWIISKNTASDGESWRFAEIVTPDNLHFQLSGGGWNTKGKLRASIAGVRITDKIKVFENDVKSYSDASSPDALISADKTPEQIVKDILRRVINNPICRDIAEKINARIKALQESQSGLAAHVTDLKAIGFTIDCDGELPTYSVRVRHPKIYSAEVYASGRVTFEVSVNVSQVAAVLALLGAN